MNKIKYLFQFSSNFFIFSLTVPRFWNKVEFHITLSYHFYVVKKDKIKLFFKLKEPILSSLKSI